MSGAQIQRPVRTATADTRLNAETQQEAKYPNPQAVCRLLSAALRVPLPIEPGDAVRLRLAAAQMVAGAALSAAEDALEAPRQAGR